MLTQEKANKVLRYSNGKLYSKINRTNSKKGDCVGNYGSHGYLQIHINSKMYRVHRVIFLMHHGYLPEMVDHIDGDKTNNCIENLRACTPSQNQHNSKMQKNNKSGCKGVYFCKKSKSFQARISANGKRIFLGCFKSIDDAAKKVHEARAEYHGNFANNGESK